MNSIQKNKDGFVLVITLLCALILSAVMLSTMFVSSKGQKLAKNFKESVQTLNAADAAIKQAKGALNTWLQTQQVGTGNVVKFNNVLSGSSSSGMVIPGNATNWGALSLFGNTVKITIANDSDGGTATTDTNRIVVMTAEATSTSRQRVRIKAYLQAPDNTNSTGVPPLAASASFCSDALGHKQVARVKETSYFTSKNHPNLPAWTCADAACVQDASYETNPANNLPGAMMYNSTKQIFDIDATATARWKVGSPYILATDPTNCIQLRTFADQVANLSDSLPNVDIVTTPASNGNQLGTRTEPKIVIINGINRKRTKLGITRTKIDFEPNTRGSGILVIQSETDTANRVAAVGHKNFYYEGLVLVQGDEWATWRMTYNSTLYGAVAMFSGSDDDAKMERTALRMNSSWIYSTAAIAQANLSLGALGPGTPVTTASDPRNSTVTVGWYEDYNF